MSADAESKSDPMSRCANCGVTEDGNIKLKICTACKSVRYCGVECQKKHRPKHKKDCKKRAAKLRDELLFKQPESHFLGDCPICMLPLPDDTDQFVNYSCCSTRICAGCCQAEERRQKGEKQERRCRCPFCRTVLPTKAEKSLSLKMQKNRAELNDPVALDWEGKDCHDAGDYKRAFEYFSKAADLGNIDSHFSLSVMYAEGQGVKKVLSKNNHHLEQAAIGGHPNARYNLAMKEFWDEDNPERAIKHLMIAAKLGFDKALDGLKSYFMGGLLSKELFAEALRGHQAAVDEMKSPHREEAKSYVQNRLKSRTT